MANAEFVEDVGVVDREIRDHQIRNQQPLKHVVADVPGLEDLGVVLPSMFRSFGRLDEVLFDLIEVHDDLVFAEFLLAKRCFTMNARATHSPVAGDVTANPPRAVSAALRCIGPRTRLESWQTVPR